MNLLSHLYLIKRNTLLIITVTFICGLTSLILGQGLSGNSFESTLFISIGTENNSYLKDESIYDHVQAADQFSETVQGWFKNPSLIEKIEKYADLNVNLSARKQEKQNVIVTFSTDSLRNANKISDSIENILKSEISIYNKTTLHNFNLAILDVTTEEQSSKLPLIVLVGLFLGLFLGLALSYTYEYVFGIASHRNQIEEILNRKTDTILSLKSLKKQNRGYLMAFILSFPVKKHIFVGIGINAVKISNLLLTDNKKLDIRSINLPKDVGSLKENEKEYAIILCQLGKTVLSDLEKFSPLLPEDYSLVILY